MAAAKGLELSGKKALACLAEIKKAIYLQHLSGNKRE